MRVGKVFRLVVAAASIVAAGPALAALTVSTNANVTAGIAGFGTATPLLDWSNGFAPGSSWTLGVFGGPARQAASFVDSATGASASGSVYVTNWIDGPGFDNGAIAGPDLALNGAEDFVLNFAAPVSRVGFAVATGLGLLQNEVSAASTSFTLRTDNGDMVVLALSNPGNGLALWVDLQSTTSFTSLQFIETGNDITDQYFGDFVAGTLPATGGVPEPASWALLITGLGLTGAAMRRRRVASVAA